MRADVIELKKRRRVHVGENLTFLFENRETVLFQVQEMMRTERIVDDDKIQAELDAYARAAPGPGRALGDPLHRDPRPLQAEPGGGPGHREPLPGTRSGRGRARVGDHRVKARFEGGHSKEEKMAAVHYLRFPVSGEARAALRRPRHGRAARGGPSKLPGGNGAPAGRATGIARRPRSLTAPRNAAEA